MDVCSKPDLWMGIEDGNKEMLVNVNHLLTMSRVDEEIYFVFLDDPATEFTFQCSSVDSAINIASAIRNALGLYSKINRIDRKDNTV